MTAAANRSIFLVRDYDLMSLYTLDKMWEWVLLLLEQILKAEICCNAKTIREPLGIDGKP